MDLVIAADRAYAVPLNACASSAITYCPDCHIHIFDCGLTADDKRTLRATVGENARLSFVAIPKSYLTGLPNAACGSPATYARLFVDLIDQAERLLYLDADTVVLSSLRPLFELDLGDATLAAVREMYTPVVSAENGVPDWQWLGFGAQDPYFNAGVMVIDCAKWRAQSIQARCLSYLRGTASAVNLFDQEALNVALHGAWLELPATWNVTRYWYKESRRVGFYSNILEDARIIHFISEQKPWLSSEVVPVELSSRFFDALDRSALAGWRPTSTRPL